MAKNFFKIDKGLNLPSNTLPLSPDEGDVAKDSADGRFKFYENGGWQTLGGGSYTDPMTTIGDLVYRNGSNVTARLPKSTDGKVFKMVSGLPAWADHTAGIYQFKVTGSLATLGTRRKRLDGAIVREAFTPSIFKIGLDTNGKTGTLELDLRRHTPLSVLVTGVDSVDSASTQSIAKVGSSLLTQSIARSTTQISTQSISRVKSSISILSIMAVQGTNKWRIRLNSAADADWSVGSSITISGCTDSGNNVTVTIDDKNVDGLNNFIVTNATGVAQPIANGTVDLNLWSYNYSGTVSTQFVAGENALFASHTSAGNNGQLPVYKINQAGNNIWVYNSAGVAQAGVLGNANVNRWQYNLTGAASTTNYIVAEKALMASHTTGANNGNFTIKAVNLGGNNIVVYNEAGVAQAGVAGNINTNRWTYSYNPNAWKAIAWSSSLGLYAAVSNNGEVATSPDGITWTQRISPEMNTWTGIAWNGTVFAAIANSGTHRVMTSSDGINWVPRNASQANPWNGIAWNGTVFAAVAPSGTNRVMTSPDGITWTNRSASSVTTWGCICANNAGRFVAVAQSGTNASMTSTDGITWTSTGTITTVSTWTAVASDGTGFVTVSSAGLVASCGSTGATWTNQTAASANAWQAIAWNSSLSLYAAVSDTGTGTRVMTSPTGVTWTTRTSAADNAWTCITSNGTNFVAMSSTGADRAETSTNGTSWTSRTPPLITFTTAVSDRIKFNGHTSSLNDGVFTVMATSSATDLYTLVTYNESGVAQAALAGMFYSAKKKVKFASDQSSTITTASIVELSGLADSIFEELSSGIGYQVTAVNSGGGTNFNIVITEENAISQPNPGGYVVMESKSVMSATAQVTGTSLSTNQPLKGIAGDYGTFVASSIPLNSYLGLWMKQNFTDGSARDLTVVIG